MDESALGFWPLAGGVVSSLPPHFLSLPSCSLFLGFIFFFFFASPQLLRVRFHPPFHSGDEASLLDGIGCPHQANACWVW